MSDYQSMQHFLIKNLKIDIQDFVKKEAASYKYPRVIEFTKSLPKTTNGKIRRDEIRRQDAKVQYE